MMMNEFYDCVEADLAKANAHVDRHYSDGDFLVIKCAAKSKRFVMKTMCIRHGWSLCGACRCFNGTLLLTLKYKRLLNDLPKCLFEK